jgi:AcrR family transcriptional regulator
MRERLLDATIECLVELGYARTSTVEVTERAGVSRGAMLHHFPSRADLMAAAVDRLATRRIAEFVASVTQVSPDQPLTDAAIDLLWTHFTNPTFPAVLELTIVARTDTELAEVLHPLVRRYDAVIARTARLLFGKLAASPAEFERARRHVYFVMQGLALRAATGGDEDEIEATLDELKEELRRQMHAARKTPDERKGKR